MATEVKLPRLGQGMESGTIVRWLKTEGDAVTKGEPLYELDTDKVTQEVEAESDGVLLKIVIADGEVDVGTTVGIIGAQDEDVTAMVAEAQGDNGGAPTPAPAEQATEAAEARSEPVAEQQQEEEEPRSSRRRRFVPRASASRQARSRGGSPVSAVSSSRRSSALGPRGASSPRTSRRPRSGRLRRRRRARNRSSRSSSSRRPARRSRDGSPRPGKRRSSSSPSARTPPSWSRRASAWSISCARARRSRRSRTS